MNWYLNLFDINHPFGIATILYALLALTNIYLHCYILLRQYNRVQLHALECVPPMMDSKTISNDHKNKVQQMIGFLLTTSNILNAHARRITYVMIFYIGIFLFCMLYFNTHVLGLYSDAFVIYLQLAIIPILLMNEIWVTLKTYVVARYTLNMCEVWFYYANRIQKLIHKGEAWLSSDEGITEMATVMAEMYADTLYIKEVK